MTERLRWGILGANSWIARDAIVPAIRKSRNGCVVAAGTRDPGAPVQGAEGIRVVSYEALLADPEVDAIYIPLPNSMHLEWAIRAAGATKPVLLEKPLALNLDEAAKIVEAFERRNVPLMESFMYRFHPQHRRVRELIDSGVIGEVVEVRTHLSVDIMNPPDPANIRMKPELGGGALLDMGCYMISVARMVFAAEPVAVRGWWKRDARFGVDVAAAGVLEFPGKRAAMVSCSFEGFGNGFYSVIGRKGVIEAPRGIIQGLGTRIGESLDNYHGPRWAPHGRSDSAFRSLSVDRRSLCRCCPQQHSGSSADVRFARQHAGPRRLRPIRARGPRNQTLGDPRGRVVPAFVRTTNRMDLLT